MAGGVSLYDDDEGGGIISDINVTPLVDITLVLLIIFMVTAKLIVGRAIRVETPKAASGEEVRTTLALTLDLQGNLFVNGLPMNDRRAASAAVSKAVRGNPEIQAIVSADRSVSHGEVIALIDLVKVAGVKRFALAADELPRK